MSRVFASCKVCICTTFSRVHHYCRYNRFSTAVVSASKQYRRAVPMGASNLKFLPFILKIMRQDVLIDPSFNEQVIFLKKSWLATSPVSESVLKELRCAADDIRSQTEFLSTVSDCDLVNFIVDIVHSEKLQKTDKTLTLLENESCRRAYQMDAKSLLHIADAFYLLDYQCSSFFSVLMTQFDVRWDKLAVTKQDVLQLAFYMNCFRKAPIQLMHRIENFVSYNSDRFTGNELGLICHTFFATNTSFKNFVLVDKIARLVLQHLSKNQLRSYMLSNVLKCLRHAHYSNIGFYAELGQCLRNTKLQKMTVNDFATLATVYSSVRMVNSELFAFIGSSVVKLSHDPRLVERSFRTKDLCRLIWSFALMCEPLDSSLHDLLISKLEKDSRLAYHYPEIFVEGLAALAMKEIYPTQLLNILLSDDFLKMKTKQPLHQDYQFLLIEAAVRIEAHDKCKLRHRKLPEPVGSLTHEMATRKGLISFILSLHQTMGTSTDVQCHFILPHSRIADIELRLDSRNRPTKFNVDLLDLAVLNEIKGKLVYQCNEEQSIFKQLFDKADKDPSVCDRTIPDNLYLKPEKSNSERRIAIKVMGWNQFAYNKPLLLGLCQMELRLLSRSGYEVYVINPDEAQQLDVMTEIQRADYVGNLFDVLNIAVPRCKSTSTSNRMI